MSDQFFSISPDLASRYINLALKALKKQGITQQEVGETIEFSSLSKAKKFAEYKNRNSNLIGGKSLNEILVSIVDAYRLSLDESKSFFITRETGASAHNVSSATTVEACYLYHYYTDSVNGTNRGILTFRRNGEVTLTIISPFNQDLRTQWRGTYKFANMYLFAELNAGKQSGFKSLHTYFAGVPNTWLDFFQGTYNGIKADGTMLVGKSLLQRVPNEEQADKLLTLPVDSRIEEYLDDSLISVGTTLIGSLQKL